MQAASLMRPRHIAVGFDWHLQQNFFIAAVGADVSKDTNEFFGLFHNMLEFAVKL